MWVRVLNGLPALDDRPPELRVALDHTEMSTDGHCARRNRQPDATSEPGDFSRVESNEAAGSTPGGALPSIASRFRLATVILPEPGPLISQL